MAASVLPGTELGPAAKYSPGEGVYARGENLFAARRGVLTVDQLTGPSREIGRISVMKEGAKSEEERGFTEGMVVEGVVR